MRIRCQRKRAGVEWPKVWSALHKGRNPRWGCTLRAMALDNDLEVLCQASAGDDGVVAA